MEELMEHWFFIEGHPIKALFHNCPGSAKRSGERGRRNQWNTGDGNTGSAAARDSKRDAGQVQSLPVLAIPIRVAESPKIQQDRARAQR